MLKEMFVLLFALAGCQAVQPAAPDPASPVRCGEMPPKILNCLHSTAFFRMNPTKCNIPLASECVKMTCVFTEINWMADGKVNKTKIAEYFDETAAEYPDWSAAVAHMKGACLGDHDLPPQGVHLNCAPYDIIHCTLTSFLRKAIPSMWKTKPECEYARAYAGACPICPDDCFAPQVPYGTCNACLSLPRSA